jgi:hypothetical protein
MGGFQTEVLDDVVDIGVFQLQDLVNPVYQLNVGIAPHLTKDGSAFDGLVADAVEFAEQGGTTDFRHPYIPFVVFLKVLVSGKVIKERKQCGDA